MGKKTGNTRHRLGLFGRLILQVQERSYRLDGPGSGEYYLVWRDAKVTDLTAGRAALGAQHDR